MDNINLNNNLNTKTTMKKISDYNEELYAEMLEDDGCQYDPELREEIKDYYLYSE